MKEEKSDSVLDLYKAIIREHSANPRNCFRLENPSASASKNNLLCGDEITVFLRWESGAVSPTKDLRFQVISFVGTGCAIMNASASLMTEALQGNNCEGALSLTSTITDFLNGDDTALAHDSPFRSFVGVRSFPSRIKCALLPFQALHDALHEVHS